MHQGLLLIVAVLLSRTLPVSRCQAPPPDSTITFKPSVAVIVGILLTMFCLTLLLLVYAKFCQVASRAAGIYFADHDQVLPLRRPARDAGVDRSVVESLPFFRFSALRGAKDGLECSICLSRFDSSEILRLLPKCKHCFHVDCIDKWLESHSSCPLCRQKIEPTDVFLTQSSRICISRTASDLTEGAGIELIVQRENEEPPSSSSKSKSFRIESFHWMPEKVKEDAFLAGDLRFLHRFKHRIIISDVIHKHRWSDVDSSDLMLLNSEMLGADIPSKRFSGGSVQFVSVESWTENDEKITRIKAEMEKKRLLELKASQLRPVSSPFSLSSASRPLLPIGAGEARAITGKRTMSDLVNPSRFADTGSRTRGKGTTSPKEEKVKRMWLSIARRTVRWFTGRERLRQQNSGI